VLALILKWITKKPWVADLRDPWTFEPLNLLLKTVKWRLALERRLERMVFNRADAIILNTPEAEKSYRKLYPRFDHKMQTITNGFDADEIRETNDELGENNPWLKYDNLFLISHIGSFFRHTISGFTPDSMLDAFQKLVLYGGLSPQNCRIVLAGHVHWEIKRKIEEIGLTDIVELPGYLSHKDALKL
jgi:glycosyltransferase involved in cell wall biosynthesis